MDDMISLADLNRMYAHSLIQYEGVYYYVDRIVSRNEIRMYNPLTKKTRNVEFELNKFIPPPTVGFVNGLYNCYYVARVPRRIYYVGLSEENVTKVLPGARYDGECPMIHTESVVYALHDLYPTIEEAVNLIKEGRTSVAFNKQFAIRKGMHLYYKTSLVGSVVNGKCVFNPGKEFLANFFRTQDVKNLRKARPAAA